MDRFVTTLLFSSFLLLSLFSITSHAQTQNCSAFVFRNNQNFATCNPLPLLNSVLHWTYHSDNHTVDLAYRHGGVTDSDWVAWGLNINGGRMAGAQCLVAFKNSSGQFQAYTAPVADYNTQLRQGSLSFNVPRIEAQFLNNEYIIFASLELPSGRTSFNQVWQNGQVSGQTLQAHSQSGDNMRSFGSVDFATGQLGNDGGSSITSRQRKRHVHGVLNAVSWGVLMPMGAVFARYLKVFKSANPAWFYLHVACQTSAYAVGVAGWGTGLKLGSDSVGIKFTTHRNIGITLFCLGTLQVFALLLRPKPDHKYRLYWNTSHQPSPVSITFVLSIFLKIMASISSLNQIPYKTLQITSQYSKPTSKISTLPLTSTNFPSISVKEFTNPKPKFTAQAKNYDKEDEWGPEVEQIKPSGGGVAVAEEEPPKEEPSEIELLKKQLVDSFYGTNRGLSASSETRAEIVELITKLESMNPTPAPTEALPLLNGKWILAYTSFSGLFPLLSRGTLPLVRVEEISQTIDSEAFAVQNSVVFAGPLATTSITTNAKFEVRSPKRVQIKFDEGVIGTPQLTDSIELPENVEFLGQKIDLSPFKGLINSVQDTASSVAKSISSQPPIKFPISNSNAQSWLLTTYLDRELRISRGDGGSVFVLIKEGSPLLKP